VVARCAAGSSLERSLHLAATKMQGRDEAGEESNERGDAEGEGKNGSVHSDGVDAGQAGKSESGESANADHGQAEAESTAEQGQQQAFCYNLAQNASPRCAKCGAHGKFSATLLA